MKGIYNASVAGYGLLVRAVAPFNAKANLWISGRKKQLTQLKQIKETWPVVWFHCASYGEFEQCRLVIAKLRQSRPSHKILITFFSPSGYEQIKEEPVADYIFYLPEERPQNIQLFFDAFPIEYAVFVRYEFWYGYMQGLFDRQIPLIFISSSFRPSQVFFKSYGGWFRKRIRQVDQFFVQEPSSEKLLSNIGITQVTISGDTRFDRVLKTTQEHNELPLVEQFTRNHPTLIFGSAWEMETKMLKRILPELPAHWKVIYAPHEIDVSKLENLALGLKQPCVRYTQLSDDTMNSRVLMVDTIGHLSRMYKYCNVAIVGGGFTTGIHNILEPMVFGLPVFFGPDHKSFWEAQASINQGLNYQFTNYKELMTELTKWLQNPALIKEHQPKALQFIVQGSGATKTVTSYLLKKIK